MYKTGIDLGGTTAKVALLDPSGCTVRKISIKTGSKRGYAAVFRDIAACVRECLAGISATAKDLDSDKRSILL